MRKLSQSGPHLRTKTPTMEKPKSTHLFFCAHVGYMQSPGLKMGPKMTPKLTQNGSQHRCFFRNIFVHFFVMLMFNLASRPGRLLFFFVVKSNNNNNKKNKQGKAIQEKTQDQTSPRQDQTDRTEQDK